jgi:stearoyl-CoA desaturase (delta-9 desaturase)
VVFVQHMTFFINSFCHMLGRQPYSSRCTARDSAIMALFTFGEGYHNFHHEFPHDYRNGVKAWQFDPTKWLIWVLSKLGLAGQLRRVSAETIILAQIAEQQRCLAARFEARAVPQSEPIHHILRTAQERLLQAKVNWEKRKAEYRIAAGQKMEASREKLAKLRREMHEATERLRAAIREWEQAHQLALAQFA